MGHTELRATILWFLAALLLGPAVGSQESSSTFDDAARASQRDLERSLADLAALREQIAREKLPLSREMSDLERKIVALRADIDARSRALDARNLELTQDQTELDAQREEIQYLSNLLGEYTRNVETRVHIAELQRYRSLFDGARLAPDTSGLTPADVFRAQGAVVEASLDRLHELVGGTTFDGQAAGPDGRIEDVRIALVGPIALYAAKDGSSAGTAEQRLGSLEPNLRPLEDPALAGQARALVESRRGSLPFDPSLGQADQIADVEDSWVQHIRKGGPVMIPILLLAGAALLVGLVKWVQLARIRNPDRRKTEALLAALARRDPTATKRLVRELPGPTGEMLRAAVDSITEPKELVEEIMFERMLDTRLRSQSYLSFVAMTASAAPLLGLLGTVTGMMTTFKLITVFGTGDAKTLSSGISEALITTEYGLIVAIPTLLLYAYLSRRAKRLVDGMEKTAISFLNRIPADLPTEGWGREDGTTHGAEPPAGSTVRALREELSAPVARSG
jgi:biopolymer transport protein ExbB